MELTLFGKLEDKGREKDDWRVPLIWAKNFLLHKWIFSWGFLPGFARTLLLQTLSCVSFAPTRDIDHRRRLFVVRFDLKQASFQEDTEDFLPILVFLFRRSFSFSLSWASSSFVRLSVRVLVLLRDGNDCWWLSVGFEGFELKEMSEDEKIRCTYDVEFIFAPAWSHFGLSE